MNPFKIVCFNFFFLVNCIVLAQIPNGYYNSAEGLTGDYLKSALHNIIKNHVEFPYTSSKTDTWDILKETDKDTANPDNVILFYSGWSVNAAQEYNNGNGWTREHVWAKSHGEFGTTMGAGTDAHHLRPCDNSINSKRSNLDFDEGGYSVFVNDKDIGCKIGAYSWEPRDAVKGDVARMLFYMAVRYEGESGEPDLELVDQVNSYELNEIGKGYHGKLSTLLQWHKSDPVDSFEINRNNVVFSYQNNRNPFIDHPEFVDQIWTLTRTKEIIKPTVKVYPNPASEYLAIVLPNNDIASAKIYSMQGNLIRQSMFTDKSNISVRDLKEGFYLLKIELTNKIYVEKFIITK